MPSSADTYSAAQAAEIIGVSERRIRQLVAEGKLPGRRGRDGTVRIPQQAVNEERRKRRTGSPAAGRVRKQTGATATAGTRKAAPVDVDALATAVASAVGQRIEGQLEVTRRAESLVRAELDEERARRAQAEARLEEAERKVQEAERKVAELEGRRGLFRRRPAGSP
ncbi:MAG TPA: helix-turn-helix domain-containing protein [Acidimicrobiales bacterium]|nr:helix-turn-helix domain-containing protein [Acidimicrobiales bacterium]